MVSSDFIGGLLCPKITTSYWEFHQILHRKILNQHIVDWPKSFIQIATETSMGLFKLYMKPIQCWAIPKAEKTMILHYSTHQARLLYQLIIVIVLFDLIAIKT
jgi:hypothetical protein